MSGVYKITNNLNGKFYVGSTKNFEKRKKEHFSNLDKNTHHNSHLQRSYNKYGKVNFKFEILIECSNYLEKEQELLNELDFKNAYNISKNSCGGDNYTHNPNKEELRIFLISQLDKNRNKNRKMDNEFNPNFKHGRYSKINSKCEICNKPISINAKKCKSCYFSNKNTFGTNNNFYGKKHSKETIDKIKAKNTGRPSKCVKAVIVGDLEFISVTKAALTLNVSQNTIINRIRNSNFPEYKYK